MSEPNVSPLQAAKITCSCDQVDARRLIREALDAAHHAGWFKENWEGSLDASARIVRELGLESKDSSR